MKRLRILKEWPLRVSHHPRHQIRKVSTWSSLATAFNTRPGKKINLSLSKNNSGLFGVPELLSYEGFYAMKDHATWETDKLIDEICSPHRTRRMVEVFDQLSDTLCKVADLAEFIRIAHPRAAFRQAAEDACISISGIVEKLNVKSEIYSALRNVVNTSDVLPTSSVDNHVAKLFLFDFEQCGIHLPDNDRQKVVYLNNAILQLGQQFTAGAVNPRTVPKSMIPESVRHLFSTKNEQVVVSSLYSDSSNSLAREIAFKIFLHPDSHQEYFLVEMLTARNELSQLCGFETYGHRVLRSSTAETPEMVIEFLNEMRDELQNRAETDFLIMRKMKIDENINSSYLAPWDTPYFSQKAKRDMLKIGNLEFAPYFSLGACMDGLNILFSNLYGIKLVNEEVECGELWTNDVYKLGVYHESEGLLGYIYCDFYERTGKPIQDCHFTIRGGRRLPDGSYQNPIVVLMLNLPTPRWSGPSLLTPSMVDNLFHEMGHAMHSMLARTSYQHVTGTRCSTDFAEVPSVLMEYFASDPRIVRLFARHFQTQEQMPEDMLHRLCASKHLFAASEMQMQVFYSALDQTYHGKHPMNRSTTQVLSDLQSEYYGLPYVPKTAWQLRFGHLVGYGAKYYSYLLSRAVASWIWQQYFEKDPLSRSSGESLRRECLAFGGGKPSRQLVADFLKKDVNPKILSSSIINEIDAKNDEIERIRL